MDINSVNLALYGNIGVRLDGGTVNVTIYTHHLKENMERLVNDLRQNFETWGDSIEVLSLGIEDMSSIDMYCVSYMIRYPDSGEIIKRAIWFEEIRRG